MRQLLVVSTFLAILFVSGCGVRLPDNYATDILDRKVEVNNELLSRLHEVEDPSQRETILKEMILEDNKVFTATSATIKAGGGN